MGRRSGGGGGFRCSSSSGGDLFFRKDQLILFSRRYSRITKKLYEHACKLSQKAVIRKDDTASFSGSWFPWSKSLSSPRLAADKPLKNSPKPKPAAPAPPPPPVQSQPQPAAGGLGFSFIDGMAFGSGNAVGHRVTDAVLGPRVIKHEVQVADPAPSAASCAASMTAFQECLNANGGDLSKCQFYMNMVCEFRRSSTTLA